MVDAILPEQRRADLLAEQTEQHLAIAREAMAAWERSRQPLETVTETRGRASVARAGDLVELPDQVVIQSREQNGDAALLGQALQALAAIRSLWGLDAPKRQDAAAASETVKAYIAIDVEKV